MSDLQEAMKPHWTQTEAGKAKMSKAMKKKHAAKRAEGKPWKSPAKKAKKAAPKKAAAKKPSRKGKLIPLAAIPHPAPTPKPAKSKAMPTVGEWRKNALIALLTTALDIIKEG